MKKSVNAFDYAGEICNAMKSGILMTTKNGDFVNTMTIGWGHIGMVWSRPTFIAYVRESRYTRTMVDNHGEFTVNIPVGQIDRSILGYCGSKSGRDVDKIKKLGLTLVDSDHISVPGIKELPLTLECRVIYRQKQDLAAIPEDLIKRYYPAYTDANIPFADADGHYMYIAEILGAYMIED